MGVVTLQVQYDPSRVSDIDQIQVLHLVNGQWVAESTNRTVDTENYTISVDVTSLSQFLAAEVSSAADVVSSRDISSGGGGSCFINSAQTKPIGFNIILLVMVLAMVLAMAVFGKTLVSRK